MTIASSTTRRRSTTRPRSTSRRREVTTMKQKLQHLLRLALRPAPRHTTLFNGQLLDQKREDSYVVMHQMGLIR
ncbi:hypothetical protein [Pseudarthrobacter sp. 1C304]|uniref:hypothetical protein n=1 Tax=Pseudarthrobacter sp. 1C304 TaxID=3457438 RepID=UPI003FD15485